MTRVCQLYRFVSAIEIRLTASRKQKKPKKHKKNKKQKGYSL